MGWFTTEAVAEFLAEAGPFLRAEPARNTVILSVTENLRQQTAAPSRGPEAPSRGTRHASTGHGGLQSIGRAVFGTDGRLLQNAHRRNVLPDYRPRMCSDQRRGNLHTHWCHSIHAAYTRTG